MSDLLQLASALRASNDSVIRSALETRRATASSARDYFDLADSLFAPKSVTRALATLPRSLAFSLQRIAEGETVAQPEIEALRRRFLVYVEDGQPRLFEAVSIALSGLSKITLTEPVAPSGSQSMPTTELASSIFTCLQSVAELIFDLEIRFVREVGKTGVGLAEIKRLASHLRQGNEFVRETFDLAQISGLVVLRNGRWQPSAKALDWLNLDLPKRWLFIVEKLFAQLDESSVAELQRIRAAGVSDIKQLFNAAFPFADSSLSDQVGKFQSSAKHLGLVTQGEVSAWFDQALNGTLTGATAEVNRLLPKPEDRLICQADLTLIAPGPLTTATELRLRTFVEVEQVGMASSYRINSLSVSHGLETGLSEAEITELLTKLSGRELPQPLSYLIREAAKKFGQLTVTQSLTEHLSVIASADEILLKQLENESRLRHLSFRRNAESQLVSRMDAEIVYNSMRSVGYPVVRTDNSGQVISPRQILTPDAETKAIDPIEEMLTAIRQRDEKSEPESDDLLRQIQLAVKNKSQLEVVVQTNSGDELTFTLEPIGIANNRLRAKDRKADIERTLPLDKILRVKLTS